MCVRARVCMWKSTNLWWIVNVSVTQSRILYLNLPVQNSALFHSFKQRPIQPSFVWVNQDIISLHG